MSKFERLRQRFPSREELRDSVLHRNFRSLSGTVVSSVLTGAYFDRALDAAHSGQHDFAAVYGVGAVAFGYVSLRGTLDVIRDLPFDINTAEAKDGADNLIARLARREKVNIGVTLEGERLQRFQDIANFHHCTIGEVFNEMYRLGIRAVENEMEGGETYLRSGPDYFHFPLFRDKPDER